MTYEDAERIRRMIDSHWNMNMPDEECDLWLSALIVKDAEAATRTVGRLAKEMAYPPKVKDIEDVYAMLHRSHVSPPSICPTCGGDAFVVVLLRMPDKSKWQVDRGIIARPTLIEEMAPCPDCNAECDTEYRLHDGTVRRCPDPDRVREMMRR